MTTQPKSIIINKTYRAIRHDVTRKKQRENDDAVHHPQAKQMQIASALEGMSGLAVLELFAGKGNLTRIYKKHGTVLAMDIRNGTGDSFLEYHRFIADKKIFDVVDIDPYGFPNRLFPDVFLLIKSGFMFLTMPSPSVNILNGITKTHMEAYYGLCNPTIWEIIDRIAGFGICHWRKILVDDIVKIGRMWRICFVVEQVKATEYCDVRNQPYSESVSYPATLDLFGKYLELK